jgi:hypothetical protein
MRAPILPCIYALLFSKKSGDYNKVFSTIKSKIKDSSPDYILVDFEKALINSLMQTFPSTKIKGCNVHLRRNIWKHIQANGFQREYVHNKKINSDVKLLGALAFSTPAEIPTAFKTFKNELQRIQRMQFFHLLCGLAWIFF